MIVHLQKSSGGWWEFHTPYTWPDRGLPGNPTTSVIAGFLSKERALAYASFPIHAHWEVLDVTEKVGEE